MYKYLDKIKKPGDIRKIDDSQIPYLARDIRKFLVSSTSKTGGHLASNLGVVELTMAIHKVFDTAKDRVIFDVGHQSYVHKILTGRKDKFENLRQLDGISGFPKTSESSHDAFNTGHSSTSISAGIGMALARDMKKENYNVISLIGDSSICSGLALEGINYLGHSKLDMLIILNDNDMSIEKNVGAISKYLSKMRVNQKYRRFSKNAKQTISNVPVIGNNAVNIIKTVKDNIKSIAVPGAIFNELGINYYGPIDGHNYYDLVNALRVMKKLKGPKLLHVITKKGKGYSFAEKDPTTYHGVGKFDVSKKIESSNKATFSDVAGSALEKVFKDDSDSIAISAAMIKGTGLSNLEKIYPKRVLDVGMEEQNAVTIAAGLAISGIKPYVAIYSTFLQRAYDQILHDVCLQNLPVTFLIDRAGIVGEDGETHNGVYDISYLSSMPNIEIYTPKDAIELEKMIIALHGKKCPVAIRFPRGIVYNLGYDKNENDVTEWEQISSEGKSSIVASGKMFNIAAKTAKILKEKYNTDIKLVNARRLKPVDKKVMDSLLDDEYIFTMEDGVKIGGFSSTVSNYISEKQQNPKLKFFAFPDKPVPHGNVDRLYERYGLTEENLSRVIYETITKGR